MIDPLLRRKGPSYRRLGVVIACNLLLLPSLALQAAGSPQSYPEPPLAAEPRSVMAGDPAFLARLIEDMLRGIEARRRAWLRTPTSFFALFLQDIQKTLQRHLEDLQHAGWQISPGEEARQGLVALQAQAQRLEAELHQLYPPLRSVLLQNERYGNVVRSLEERKRALAILPQPTLREQAERQQLEFLLAKKDVMLDRVARLDRYEGIPYPMQRRLAFRHSSGMQAAEMMGMEELEAYAKDKLTALQLRSSTWAKSTAKLLFESEKLLNLFKEFSPEDNRLLSGRTEVELSQPAYARLDGIRQRLHARIAGVCTGPLAEDWKQNGILVEALWQEVRAVQGIAKQRAQAAPETAEAAVYAQLQQSGQPGLYRILQADQDAARGDTPAPLAQRGRLSQALAASPQLTSVVGKLRFAANRGELGALLWLHTLQRLQRSTSLLERTLQVVAPTVAARGGPAAAARLGELLLLGHSRYDLLQAEIAEKPAAERYQAAQQQLAGVEAQYWKVLAKFLYPYGQAEEQLQAYFRPGPAEGAAGTQAEVLRRKFQEVWQEQQEADQLPRLSRLAWDHLLEVLERKPEVVPWEMVVQLLTGGPEPLLHPDQVRMRRALNQLLARPDWSRLRPQVEGILSAEPLTFYLELMRRGLLEERNRRKLARLADAVQRIVHTLPPEAEGYPLPGPDPTARRWETELLAAPAGGAADQEMERAAEERRRAAETSGHSAASSPREPSFESVLPSK